MPKSRDAKKKRYLSLIIRTGVAAAAILWVFHGQDWGKVGQVLRQLNPWYLGLSLAAFFASQLVCAFRWWGLLRAQSIYLDLGAVVKLHLLGLFYNNVMPGSVGGDLVKAWYVTKHTNKRLEGALSVVIDRLVGLTGMLTMAIVAYTLFMRGRTIGTVTTEDRGIQEWFAAHDRVILGLLLGILGVLGLILAHPAGRVRFGTLGSRVLQRIAGLSKRVWDAIVVYCSKPWTMLWALLLTIIAQSLVVLAFWLLGRNLGIEAGAKYYFVIFPVTWVVAAVPISPAGVGILEAGMVELFTRLAASSAESALALAFCQRFVWVLASLPGGAIHLLGAHLPKDFFVDVENPVN